MLSESRLFLKLWLRNPLKIGAVAPSSRELAEAMARAVPADGSGRVIELGGGTGAVTDALLDAGLGSRLVVVERDPALYRLLVDRYKHITIVAGDASELVTVLRPIGIASAGAIVSSLPILSMRKSVQLAIAEQAFALLEPGAPLIQFTYGLFSPLDRRELRIQGCVSERVLINLPPASVWVYRRPVNMSHVDGGGDARAVQPASSSGRK